MLTLDQLLQQVNAYRMGLMRFDEFEDWYRSSSWGVYDRAGDSLSDAIAAIEAAFVSYDLDEISEDRFREELVNSVHPFAAWAVPPLLEIRDIGWHEEPTSPYGFGNTQSDEAFQSLSTIQIAGTNAISEFIPAPT